MEDEKKNSISLFISSINKKLLDFDQEKICSITLKSVNIYGCLVCGKYYQGKGKSTPCYIHSLSESHNLFINLETRAIFCIPDDYEIKEEDDKANYSILYEIKQNLLPIYTKKEIKLLDKISSNYSTSLDNKKFYPGYIGLGYVKNLEYFNVTIQALSHLKSFRNFFLEYNHKINNKDDFIEIFIKKISEIIKKLWNPSNFKTHIDQRECLQLLIKASENKFNFDKKGIDVISFLSWFLNTLKFFLTEKKYENIIEEYFQGIIELETYTLPKENESEKRNLKPGESFIIEDGVKYIYTKNKIKFLYLTLDLPMAPLFKDSQEKITIPQVNIYELFKKYNGSRITEDPAKAQRKKYRILSLPKYLILIFKRFENNSFFMEKNPTIINFQLENLILEESRNINHMTKLHDKEKNNSIKKYNLISNIIHDGKPGEGTFRIQIKHKGRNEWFEIQDINVQKILPESVIVGESYVHFYELVKNKNNTED